MCLSPFISNTLVRVRAMNLKNMKTNNKKKKYRNYEWMKYPKNFSKMEGGWKVSIDEAKWKRVDSEGHVWG